MFELERSWLRQVLWLRVHFCYPFVKFLCAKNNTISYRILEAKYQNQLQKVDWANILPQRIPLNFQRAKFVHGIALKKGSKNL